MPSRGSYVRRKVEIEYDLKTQSAVAEIRRFSHENATALRGIRTEARHAASELQDLKRGALGVGAALVGAFGAQQAISGLRSIIQLTREYRGESDDIIRATGELGSSLRALGAAFGTVLLGAGSGGDGFKSMAEGIRSLAEDMVDASTPIGTFTRDVIGGMVDVAALAAEAILRVVQAVQTLVGVYETASNLIGRHEAEDLAGDVGILQGRLYRTGTIDPENLTWEQAAARAQGFGNARQIGRQLSASNRLFTSENLAELGLPPNLGALPVEQAILRVDTRLEELAGTLRTTDDLFDDLFQRVQGPERMIESLREMRAELREGLSQSFTLGPDMGGQGQALREQRQEYEWQAAMLVDLAARAGARADQEEWVLTKLREQTAELKRQIIAEGTAALGAEAARGMLELAQSVARDVASVTSLEDIFVGSLPNALSALQQAEGAFGRFLARGLRDVRGFGEEFKNTLGGLFSGIGSNFASAASMVIAGAASGPWGLFLALGGAFSLLGGLLSGGGGGGGRITTPSGSPAILSSIRPEVSRTVGNVTYVVQTGSVFFTRDDSRRELAGMFEESRRLGELGR